MSIPSHPTVPWEAMDTLGESQWCPFHSIPLYCGLEWTHWGNPNKCLFHPLGLWRVGSFELCNLHVWELGLHLSWTSALHKLNSPHEWSCPWRLQYIKLDSNFPFSTYFLPSSKNFDCIAWNLSSLLLNCWWPIPIFWWLCSHWSIADPVQH